MDEKTRDELRDDFLKALGEVAVQGGMLEHALVDLYWASTRLGESELIKRVRDWTLGKLRTEALDAFKAWTTDPDLLKQADDVLARLKDAVAHRNEYIHASWAIGATYVSRTRNPRGGTPRGQYLQLTVEDVENTATLIGETAAAVWDLYDQVIARTDNTLFPARAGIVLPDGTYIPKT